MVGLLDYKIFGFPTSLVEHNLMTRSKIKSNSAGESNPKLPTKHNPASEQENTDRLPLSNNPDHNRKNKWRPSL